jgi:hypothetical protein
MHNINHARGAGRCTPTRETTRVASAGRIEGKHEWSSADFRADGIARQAADVIEGEQYAQAYLDRLQRGTVTPDDLAVLMAFLRGEMLAGACRVIEEALGVRHA